MEMDMSAVSSVSSIDRENGPPTVECRIMTHDAWVRSALLGPTEASKHRWFKNN